MAHDYPRLPLTEAIVRMRMEGDLPLSPALLVDLHLELRDAFPRLLDAVPWPVPGSETGWRITPPMMEAFEVSADNGLFIRFQREMIAWGWRRDLDFAEAGYPGYANFANSVAERIRAALATTVGEPLVGLSNMSYGSELPAGADSLDYLPVLRTEMSATGRLVEGSILLRHEEGPDVRYSFGRLPDGRTRMESAAGIAHPAMSLSAALEGPLEDVHGILKRLFADHVTPKAVGEWK